MYHCLVFGYGQLANGQVDDQTKDRCDRAVVLWKKDLIRRIHLTVSAKKSGVSMAEMMHDYLYLGIGEHNPNFIRVDPRGGNTAGELDVFLEAVGRFKPKLLLVSTWYHIPRIMWLALWRGRLPWLHYRVGIAWRHAHWRADVLKEFLKLGYAILRPRKSAKVLAWPISSDL